MFVFFADGATAVCCSDVMHELHGVVYTRTDTDQILFSRSQDSHRTLAPAVSCNGEPGFPVEEFTSQNAREFIQMRKKCQRKQ